MNRACRVVSILVVLTAASGSVANAQSELLRTDDGLRTLINKTVGGERWAITLDPERGSVTGNVLLPNGGVTFIDCGIRSSSPPTMDLRCQSGTPAGWSDLGDVSLPASFFGLTSGCPFFGYLLTLSYSDSCGVRGTAMADFVPTGVECARADTAYDASDVALEGLKIALEVDPSGGLRVRLTYHGACQGEASGAGRITNVSRYSDGALEATVTGSTTCCPNLSANFGLSE